MKRCPICGCEPRKRLAVSEVAVGLGVSDRTIRRWIKRGLLVATQYLPPDGMYQVHHDSVDDLVVASRRAS